MHDRLCAVNAHEFNTLFTLWNGSRSTTNPSALEYRYIFTAVMSLGVFDL